MFKTDQIAHIVLAAVVAAIVLVVPHPWTGMVAATLCGGFREADQMAWRLARRLDLRDGSGHTTLKGLPASAWIASFNPLAWTRGNQIDFLAFVVGGAAVSLAAWKFL